MTPELDLTPEEINDPRMMQLWVAPIGTPLPSAWDGDVDLAFRFVGMVARDAKARLMWDDAPAMLFGSHRRHLDPGPVAMTLTWHRLLRKHAAVLPLGVYCSAVFGMPAEQLLGVAPRVALKDFETDLWAEGASCTAVLEETGPDWVSLAWHAGAPIVAAR